MSVFKLHEWWSARAGAGEEFTSGGFIVGNLDNSPDGTNKIAVGSLEGLLRVYAPSTPSFRVEDLILESNISNPILQLATGRFVSTRKGNVALAVLHPRTLAVYEIIVKGVDSTGGGGYHSLEKLYSLDLGIDGQHFSAYNMTTGAFGGGAGGNNDMIAVQSMDGKLQIFEHNSSAFTRQFVDCLYPGPLRYLPRLDAFLTVSTSCEAQCFRYQVLVNSQGEIGGQAAQKTGAFGLTAVRSTLMEWSVVVGESCLLIIDGYFSGTDNGNYKKQGDAGGNSAAEELLLVCDKSLFLVKESGGVLQQRRLDRTPTCACKYRSAASRIDNFLLASCDSTIQVYSRFNLVWAVKVDNIPISIAVSEFGGQAGLIVTMDDMGTISTSFLGTKPPLSVASSTVSRELDYAKVEEEHKSLLQIIRQHQTSSKLEPKEKLILRSQVPRQLDMTTVGPDVELPPDLVPLPDSFAGISSGGLVRICVRLYVAFSGKGAAQNVSVIVSAPAFVHVVPKNYIIKSVSAHSTPVMIKLYMYASKSQIAASLQCDVTATYKTAQGEPRIANHAIQLPLFLACTLCPAAKAAAFKFTLESGKAPVPLTELFDDLIFALKEAGQNVSDVVGNSEAHALGFQLWSNSFDQRYTAPAMVSILLSKSGGRYRIQSDSLPSLYLLCSELERRLNMHAKQGQTPSPAEKNPGLAVSSVRCAADERLPLEAFFEEITSHFSARKRLQAHFSELNDSSHLFRVIEKRLLTRFKDRNASSLGGMDILMRETYDHLLQLADLTQEAQYELQQRQISLGCISKLLTLLTGVRLQMTQQDRMLLETYFCPNMPHGTGGCSSDGLDATGWEETVELSLTFLLKTALAKVPKSTTKVNTSPVEMPESVDTLKQRISLVFVKLEEGKKMTVDDKDRDREREKDKEKKGVVGGDRGEKHDKK